MNTAQIVQLIREHAIRNYNAGGWDYLVECWSDDDIIDAIGGADDSRIAISRCAEVLEMLDSHRAEIRATEW